MRNTEAGQVGYCLKNNKECEEWAYYRGECKLEKEAEKTAETKNTAVQSAAEQTKFLVHYPWKKGESWTLTTDFHDENCLDFVNFDNDNAEVAAAADGQVLLSTHSYENSFNTYGPVKTNNPEDMGNFVIIKHKDKTYSIYIHLQHESSPPVKMGDLVKSGQIIGHMGNTGWSHGRHLHFCVVDVSIFPTPSFITKPIDSWGFVENEGSNKLILNQKYVSENE
ncbi:peptidoglycan DD-metalloendopeptidase family protein [Candidatus Woesearchaeota archaeon]|nr:peptidoglycan DD-metalloendopeptidase family protein [Candidatus Woesearchaeota archaeon]